MNLIVKTLKKIKNNKKMILAIILLLFFIEQFTVINIISSSLFKKSEYDDYTYIYQGVKNNHSEIIRLSESPYNSIMYDEKDNYFIVYGDDEIRKINNKGVEEFLISRNDDVSYANSGKFVFTKDMVYDFSKEIIKGTKIKKVIDVSGEQLELDGFLSLLSNYYQKANTVIYANVETFGAKNHKVYLKIEDEWIGIYISMLKSTGINFYPSGQILKKFPEKFPKLIFLKNPINNVYSSRSSGNENFSSVPDDLKLTKEEEMEYPSNNKINISFYQKERTSGVIAYTSIPVSFKGTAYFDLEIGKEAYKFKEMGIKNIGFSFTVKHDISYYVLPEKYLKKSEVSFLKVFPSSNLHKTDSKGLYVVRPIHNEIGVEN